MSNEFENALAWFRPAPDGWIESGERNLAACAEWIWEVLQGDFNDDQSTAQVVTGTVISMIPFVDQICDVRDVCANCRNIQKEPSSSWHWFSLALTLIGLFPTLGSLLKGCLKVAFASVSRAAAVRGITPPIAHAIDNSVAQLGKFFGLPQIVAALRAVKWDNPFKILASEVRKIVDKLNASALLSALDEVGKAAESMLRLVERWGGKSLAKKIQDQLEMLANVRRQADQMLPQTLGQLRDYLSQLARRLDIETDMIHRAYLDKVNPHGFKRLTEAEEVAAFEKEMPKWVGKTPVDAHPRLKAPPLAQAGWPSTDAYRTFHSMEPVILPPGTTLYRIVDPNSLDTNICWMTEAEFKMLKSKDDWRRRFAVWAKWNSNGEFVTYTVPPGGRLHVWEGITASQNLDGTAYVLEGGARQIVLDPAHLEKTHLSARQKTNWGYEDLGNARNLVGVPVQRNNWEIK